MTVGEMFEKEDIPEEFIFDNFEGEYWTQCDHFISLEWETDIEYLSQKQYDWMKRILDDCIEKRIDMQ